VFGRSYRVMKDGFDSILKNLPFPVIEIHPNNGNEFFNQHLLLFWKNKVLDLDISRSRPYQKNDNPFVEENNASLVKAYVGHVRLDTLEYLSVLRALYSDLCVYHNFFLLIMKMVQKDYINEFHYRRVFDQARPFLDRLVDAGVLRKDKVEALFRNRDQMISWRYTTKTDKNINALWKVKGAKPCIPLNIFETLRKEEDSSVTSSFDLTGNFW